MGAQCRMRPKIVPGRSMIHTMPASYASQQARMQSNRKGPLCMAEMAVRDHIGHSADRHHKTGRKHA